MRGSKIPQVFRHPFDRSITLNYGSPKYSLIWLHGLGDEGQSFVPYFSHLQSPLFQHCRVKLLQAPRRYFTLLNQQTNSWYDIRSMNRFQLDSPPEQQIYDLGQLQNSSSLVASHVRQEQQYWRQEKPNSKIAEQHRVFLGGFSQGAAVILNYALSAQHVPAGVIAASGYLLKHSKTQNNGKLPLLLLHGDKDLTIPQKFAKNSYNTLLQKDAMAQYETMKGIGHEMNLQQLKIMKKWLAQSFAFIEKHYEA